ncbi:MAG TPA: hypothetical protein VFZ24_11685 [Longimicrobiales bacterium]
MTRRRRLRSSILLTLLAAACSDRGPDTDLPADTSATADTAAAAPAVPEPAARAEWPDSGAVEYRREREVDLTGDGSSETVIATARGPAYDSLDVALTIEGAAGDTLWRESWPSLMYFKYDRREGKPDTAVMRIVRDRVEQLLEPGRFTMSGGLPDVLRRGGDPDAQMREAIQYHLAELDYRRSFDFRPADPTPPDAHGRIDATSVAAVRVEAVLAELKRMPSYMYFAGGEATYVIAWSSREDAFVRIFACC